MRLVEERIERYADRYTPSVEKVFESLRKETYAHCKNPGMQVGKVEGSFLKMLVAISGARRVVEIGTFTGYSALMMALPYAMPACDWPAFLEVSRDRDLVCHISVARTSEFIHTSR